MAGPSVSLRKYIKWGDAEPSEPTSTIVLSSPQRRFVDIRLLLPLPVDGDDDDDDDDGKVIRDLARLEWALGGTSERTPGETTAAPVKATFHHWVDSRYVDAEAATDVGYMTPSDGEGEAGVVEIERGEMVNFGTGRVEAYEECWVDEEDDDGGDVSGWVLRFEKEGGKKQQQQQRGMMVRVGERVQGVVRAGNGDEEVGAVRWTCVDDGGAGGGRVVVVAAIGLADWFPDQEGLGAIKRLGDAATSAQGQVWTCVECW